MIVLRPYQEQGVSSIYQYFHEFHGNPVLAMPTGTGKSLVIAAFVKSVFQNYQGQRILGLTHVKELITQNFQAVQSIWPAAPVGINSAGLRRRDIHTPILFGGIASVRGWVEYLGKIDLIIIDECHLVSHKADTMYRKLVAYLKGKNPMLKVIGLSATPFRMGLGMITDGGIFDDVCFDMTSLEKFNELIKDGYLVPPIPKPTSVQLNVEHVGTQGGDFKQKDLQAAVDKDYITRKAVDEMIELADGRKHWLIFASGIHHAENIAEFLRERNVTAEAVHSKRDDRDELIEDFKAGHIQAIVNYNILTTGFDFPAIDHIGMLRPTKSPGLWVQMLGRGTRPSPGKKNCLVLDYAGNTRRLGPINDPIIPSRKGSRRRGMAPVRLCPQCNTFNHISAKVCINCGFEFPQAVKLETEASTAALLAGELPLVDVFPVQRIEYKRHNKQGRPPSMRVYYYSGLRRFSEWVCFEHGGYAQRKAREWWHERAATEVPTTIDECVMRSEELRVPKKIRVWVNKQHPEILSHEF